MNKGIHIKNRLNTRKNQINRISLQNPLAFSIQLKPSKHSQSSSPTSQSQHISSSNLKTNQVWSTKRKTRTVSAQISNASVRILSGKPYGGNWSHNEVNKTKGEKQDIKWIGVYPQPKNGEQSHSQAFPKRKQRYADQSFANFMLRYAKFFKTNRDQVNKLQSEEKIEPNFFMKNAATAKVKPRLMWYQRKKNNSSEKSVNNKQQYDVMWLKN